MEKVEIIILAVALVATNALYAWIILRLIDKHLEEKKDLHNRLMSRDYPEYLQGEHTQQGIRAEEEKSRNKPKEHERMDKDFLAHKKKAEQF